MACYYKAVSFTKQTGKPNADSWKEMSGNAPSILVYTQQFVKIGARSAQQQHKQNKGLNASYQYLVKPILLLL